MAHGHGRDVRLLVAEEVVQQALVEERELLRDELVQAREDEREEQVQDRDCAARARARWDGSEVRTRTMRNTQEEDEREPIRRGRCGRGEG